MVCITIIAKLTNSEEQCRQVNPRHNQDHLPSSGPGVDAPGRSGTLRPGRVSPQEGGINRAGGVTDRTVPEGPVRGDGVTTTRDTLPAVGESAV